jgi:hypothetical protein
MAWRSISLRMSSTRVNTSWTTDRCTSSASGFQRIAGFVAVVFALTAFSRGLFVARRGLARGFAGFRVRLRDVTAS